MFKAGGKLMGRLHGVPEEPPHYFRREVDLVELKQKLLTSGADLGITGQSSAVGVQGMGGIGKTVLAAALARDLEVRQMFHDGIYWLTVGQKPNLLELQNQLLRQLKDSKQTLTTEQEAKDSLREALEGRPVLLVIDDPWTIEHADAFRVTVPPARLLITTRNNAVLVGLGAGGHRVDVLSPSDALSMLTGWLGTMSPPPEAAEVAKECGYLPLALAMIGAMIRLRPTAWKDALDRLRRADLEAIKRVFPGYPYPDLLRAIEVSIDALESPDRERYLALAVFPKDHFMPESALGALWGLSPIDTRACMTLFVARSLATWASGETALLLHDLQHDLIRKQRQKDLPDLHLRLVKAWDALPKLPDPYAWRWIAYHLAHAGRKDDLRQLLVDFSYLEAKITATDANALIADYAYIPEEEELRLIQSALRISAHVLARDKRQLAGQLTGRLLGNTAPEIQGLLKQAAERKPWAWLRPLKPSLPAPGGPLIRTFEGHEGRVLAVAVTPDARRAVSGSDDKTLRIWDLDSGQILRTLQGHSGSVNALAITPDGGRAVSASSDRTLRLWDLGDGEIIRTLEGHTDSVLAVALTPDGLRAVSASDDRTLRLWDLESGQTIRILLCYPDWVSAVVVTTDGRRAVAGSRDGKLCLWDLDKGLVLRNLEGHINRVSAVAVTPDGRHVVSGSDDNTLRFWELDGGQTPCTLSGHREWIKAVAVTPDGLRAMSASGDTTLRLWELESGRTLRVFKGHTSWVTAVALTTDGRRAVSASSDKTLRLWDLEISLTIPADQEHTGEVTALAVTPDGRRAVSGSDDKTLRIWDLKSDQTLRPLQGHSGSVNAVAVTPDGRHAVSASEDATLLLWDLENGQSLRELKGHKNWVTAVAITPEGRNAASVSHDRTLRLWDLENGQTLRTIDGRTDLVWALTVTPDGRHAVSASLDLTLRRWDLESTQLTPPLEHTRTLGFWDWETEREEIPSLEQNTDLVNFKGEKTDGRCAVWYLEKDKAVRGHADWVLAVSVTPDGHRAVWGSHNGNLQYWDKEWVWSSRPLPGHTGSVRAVAMTTDGCLAVSASEDLTLRVWDLNDGKELSKFFLDAIVKACRVAEDNRTIVAGDCFGRVHFLEIVEPDKTKPLAGETKIPLLRRKENSRSVTNA
jgi:WD40 repeat protein